MRPLYWAETAATVGVGVGGMGGHGGFEAGVRF